MNEFPVLTSAILIDHLGRVLLTEDSLTQTLAPPTTPLRAGVSPIDALAQAIRDTTGIIALPIRLTGIYASRENLTLAFRTIQRGGAIREEDGRPVAGFFETSPLPDLMLPATRRQIDDALHHIGGPPLCAPMAITLSGRLRDLFAPGKPASHAPKWGVRATLILKDSEGQVVWQREPGQAHAHLPSTTVGFGELPCTSAVHLIHDLSATAGNPMPAGIFLHPSRPIIEFVFTASGTLPPSGAPGTLRSRPGAEPDECLPSHVAHVTAVGQSPDDIVIRFAAVGDVT